MGLDTSPFVCFWMAPRTDQDNALSSFLSPRKGRHIVLLGLFVAVAEQRDPGTLLWHFLVLTDMILSWRTAQRQVHDHIHPCAPMIDAPMA